MAGTARGGPSRGARGSGPSSNRGGSAGCLIWLIVFSFIFLLFVLNWGRITDTLERTNFKEILKNERQADKVAPVVPAPKVAEQPSSSGKGLAQDQAAGQKPAAASPKGAVAPVSRGTPPIEIQPANPKGAAATASTKAAEKALSGAQTGATHPAALYFVRIDDDGVIVRQEVTRLIPGGDSPLTEALSALVRGPDENELRKHLVSLIPAGTTLLGVRLQGTTALVNLSEAFMYNHYGIEGYAGQLKQIIYTATAFPTVHDVQILIDGERHDYLGGEGVYIGKPLSRNSF